MWRWFDHSSSGCKLVLSHYAATWRGWLFDLYNFLMLELLHSWCIISTADRSRAVMLQFVWPVINNMPLLLTLMLRDVNQDVFSDAFSDCYRARWKSFTSVCVFLQENKANVKKIVADHVKQSNSWSHTHTFNGLFSRTTWVSRHQKGKPFWILLKQEMMDSSGISWTICKSFAPHSRQTTTSVPHHSIFYGPDAFPDAQPTVSKHWRQC